MANHFDLTDLQLIVNIGDASSLTRGAEKSHPPHHPADAGQAGPVSVLHLARHSAVS